MSTSTPEDFFANVGGDGPLPSAKLSVVDDFVQGEIVDTFMVEAKDFATGEILKDKKTGKTVMQMVVVLQTDQRNWDKVAKVPLTDPNDKKSAPLPPSEDKGRRAVYVKPFTNIHAAVRDAIVKAVGKPENLKVGGKFGVKITELEDVGKGNPKKHHAAHYELPAFFGGNEAAPAAETAAAPAAQPATSAPQGQDPWGGQSQGEKPPF